MQPVRPTCSLGAALVLLAFAGCGGDGPAPESVEEPAGRRTVPGPDLGPEDEIDAVDLLVGPQGGLHAAWREVDRLPDGSGLPEYRTRHARSSSVAAPWSAPEALPFRAPPRLALVAGVPHAIAGPRLESARRGEGGSWRPTGPLLPAGFPSVSAFDLATPGGTLVVAGITGGGPEQGLTLFTLRAPDGAPLRLVEHGPSPFDPPAPRLLADGPRLHLLWAFNAQERHTVEHGGRTSEEVRAVARLFYSRSEDRGKAWGPPVEITSGAREPPSTIDSVALVRHEDDLLALYASFGLHASRSPDGRAWSPPVRVTGAGGSSLEGGTGVRSLTAAAGAAAWIDERFRESDRRWWNPLGGWPWSDDPDWADNDLLVLPVRSVAAALDGSGAAPEPRRVTPDLTHVSRAAAGATSEGLLLLWAGRHPVGPARDSRGAAPGLTLSRLDPPAPDGGE